VWKHTQVEVLNSVNSYFHWYIKKKFFKHSGTFLWIITVYNIYRYNGFILIAKIEQLILEH